MLKKSLADDGIVIIKKDLGRRWPPAREVAQLRVESVHGSKSSQGVPHVPVGRDVVAS